MKQTSIMESKRKLQTFFIFTPILGEIQFDTVHIFTDGLKPPTRYSHVLYIDHHVINEDWEGLHLGEMSSNIWAMNKGALVVSVLADMKSFPVW